MVFNHYAKLKRIIDALEPGWHIKRIDTPTAVKTFRGETRFFDHYYRLYAVDGSEVKFGKFQQLDRLASVLGCDAHDLPVR